MENKPEKTFDEYAQEEWAKIDQKKQGYISTSEFADFFECFFSFLKVVWTM